VVVRATGPRSLCCRVKAVMVEKWLVSLTVEYGDSWKGLGRALRGQRGGETSDGEERNTKNSKEWLKPERTCVKHGRRRGLHGSGWYWMAVVEESRRGVPKDRGCR
jgi:hypothetical protein